MSEMTNSISINCPFTKVRVRSSLLVTPAGAPYERISTGYSRRLVFIIAVFFLPFLLLCYDLSNY